MQNAFRRIFKHSRSSKRLCIRFRVLVTRTMTGILIGSGNDEMCGRNELHPEEPAASYKWIPPVTRKPSVQSSFWEILVKYLKLYCENTCLVGFKYSVYKKATIFGR